MGLQFYLFQELQIIQEGNLLPAIPQRVQNLLAFLLLRPQLKRREQIVDTLFPDDSHKQGRRQLSDLLYQLRQALPEAPFIVDRDHISLHVAARWLDVDRFRECLKANDIIRWEEGMRLYRGDLLMSSYEDWLIEEREILRSAFVNMAHHLGEQWVEQHNYAKALPFTEQLVREEPYDEQALRRLMRIFQALGRRGQALRIYDHYLELAATDLGLAPELSTQMLAQTIRDACPVSYPHTRPGIKTNNSYESLLTLARQALNKSERSTVESLLKQLQQQSPQSAAEQVLWVEIDLALRFHDIARAERCLARCDHMQASTMIRQAELALTQHRWKSAVSIAEEAFLAANGTGDAISEVRALWVIANAEYQVGKRLDAYRAGERALAIARLHCPPENTIDCLVTLGRMLVTEGRLEQAGIYISEAIALARRYEFLLHYAHAMWLSGWAQSRAGHLGNALNSYEEALTVCRNVGVPRLEAQILNDLAECCDLLGNSGRSLGLLKEAETLLNQLHDPIPVAINQYHQVFTLLYLGDDQADQALALAQTALSVFRQHEQMHWVAVGLVALGYAAWVGGHHRQALSAQKESYLLHEQLNEQEKFCEILALQALALLGLGETAEAIACSRRAVLAFTQGARAKDMQVDVYYAHAMALAAIGDHAQSEDYLARAYNILIEIASALEDETARQNFFSRGPITRRLMQEIYRRGLAKPVEARQRTQWLESREGRFTTQVQWTVDAGPADVALKQAKGAIAVRRARLCRLIEEASRQGVQPKEADLAAILGVSIRTIQRDLAHLRQTNWKK